MSPIERLLRHLRALMRSEEGMALPFAAFAMAATLALGAAAVLASVDVQQGAHRDSAAKTAAAAADAGANVALMRLNRYVNSLEPESDRECLGVEEGRPVVRPAVGGWCKRVEEPVGGATYAYQVSAMVAGGALQVVSTGTSAGTSQRIDVTLGAVSAQQILGQEGLISEGDISGNGNPHIRDSVGANGSIEMSGSWEICGNARHGIGETGPKTRELCRGGEESEGNISLPPVSSFIPAEIGSPTYNSDKRLEKSCLTTEPRPNCDGYSSVSGRGWPYDPMKRSLNLSSHTVLTLGGGDYWLCKLTLEGSSELVMAARAEALLFFDTPEDCGMSSSEPQIKVLGNTGIASTGYDPPTSYEMLGIFMLGGPTSKVELGGNNGTNELLLYAPDTSITIGGTATYKGPIVAGSIELPGNPTLEEDEGYEARGLPSNTLYSRQSYIECSGSDPVSMPNENC